MQSSPASRIHLQDTSKAQSLALPFGSQFLSHWRPFSQVPGPYLGGFSTVR